MSEICWSCKRGQCAGCITLITDADCVCDHVTPVRQPAPEGPIAAAVGVGLNLESDEPDTVTRTRRYKNDDAVTDVNSTGRKRAAKLYPLTDANGNKFPCDLAGKIDALPNYYQVQISGCGVRPGTMPNPAQARHHWSYNVLDNERTNIGLLCNSCHALVHAKNDPFKADIYERLYGFKPDVTDLQWANKALKSGVVGGGQIASKSSTLGNVPNLQPKTEQKRPLQSE